MFERVVIRRHESRGKLIDPGLFAESLLFYEHVHLLLDSGCLRSLLTTVGPDVLLSLIELKRVTATCLTDNLGVITNRLGPISYHQFSAFTIAKDKDGRRIRPRDSIMRTFTEALGNSAANRRKAERLIAHLEFRANVPVVHRSDGTVADADPMNITAQARKDIEDVAYLRRVIERGLSDDVPEYRLPEGWEFELIKTSQGYVHSTNLDFERINQIYHKRIPVTENTITPAWLLGKALNARADLVFAADYMSELVTDELSSGLIQERFAGLLARQRRSTQEQQAFQEVVLSDAKAIREAINSGERTFSEFLHLLDKAARFRSWLHGRNPDGGLVAEYIKATNTETWTSTLPSRIARFVLCTLSAVGCEHLMPGVGGIAAGATIGAADQFLLERLVKGWRPNQFVEGPLKAFVAQ